MFPWAASCYRDSWRLVTVPHNTGGVGNDDSKINVGKVYEESEKYTVGTTNVDQVMSERVVCSVSTL